MTVTDRAYYNCLKQSTNGNFNGKYLYTEKCFQCLQYIMFYYFNNLYDYIFCLRKLRGWMAAAFRWKK